MYYNHDSLDCVFKADFATKNFFELRKDLGWKKIDADFLTIGIIAGFSTSHPSIDFFLNNQFSEQETKCIFRNGIGIFLRIQKTEDGFFVICSGDFSMFYTIKNNEIIFSANHLVLEEFLGSSLKINYDSAMMFCEYLRFPPLSNTFFENMYKVEGGFCANLCQNSIKNEIYISESKEDSNTSFNDRYAQTIDLIAKAYADYCKANKLTPIVLISGVDSCVCELALSKYIEVKTIHINVNELQNEHMHQYIKMRGKEDSHYEIKENLNLSSNLLIENAQRYLSVAHKESTSLVASRFINQNFSNKVMIFSGCVAGFGRTFNSSLTLHNPINRIAGSLSRFIFTDFFARNILAKVAFPKLFKHVILASYIPGSYHEEFKPFTPIASLLPSEHKQIFRTIIEKYYQEFARYFVSPYNAFKKAPKKYQFLWNNLLVFTLHKYYFCKNYKRARACNIPILNDSLGTRLLLSYKVPISDVIYSKQAVYSYFSKNFGFEYSYIAKKAKATIYSKNKNLKYTVIKPLVRSIATRIPAKVKKLRLYNTFRVNYRKNILQTKINDFFPVGKNIHMPDYLINSPPQYAAYFKQLHERIVQNMGFHLGSREEKYFTLLQRISYLKNCDN